MSYCIMIESEIRQVECPLQKGACYYQHRTTGNCKYADYKTLTDYCNGVGLSLPKKQDLETDIERLRAQLKEEL